MTQKYRHRKSYYTMTVLLIGFFLKRKYIIGRAVKNIAEFFNSQDRNILIFTELVKSMFVDALIDEGILRDAAFFHGFP